MAKLHFPPSQNYIPCEAVGAPIVLLLGSVGGGIECASSLGLGVEGESTNMLGYNFKISSRTWCVNLNRWVYWVALSDWGIFRCLSCIELVLKVFLSLKKDKEGAYCTVCTLSLNLSLTRCRHKAQVRHCWVSGSTLPRLFAQLVVKIQDSMATVVLNKSRNLLSLTSFVLQN
jgi:transcription elongation factor Elf1